MTRRGQRGCYRFATGIHKNVPTGLLTGLGPAVSAGGEGSQFKDEGKVSCVTRFEMALPTSLARFHAYISAGDRVSGTSSQPDSEK